MLSVEQTLTRLHIDHTSRLGAVQDVRHLIEGSPNPISAAKLIISNLSDVDFNTNDATEARMTAQRLVQDAILLGEKYDPTQALERAAKKIAEQRVSNPWFFSTDSTSSVVSTTETREGVNVEVKTDGKIKKGGKQILAAALYEKHKALSNKEIIEIFMKELDMSKPGATTYFYTCKKGAK
jgi:hypothetical protein